MRFFNLDASFELGAAIAAALGIDLAAHEERNFADTEFKIRSLDSVERKQVIVCRSLFGDDRQSASDKLLRLLVFIGSLKDAGAAEVVALVPYLAFSRQDRRTKPFDAVTTRYVAAFFEAAGADALVTADVHDPAAFDNAFRRRKVNVEAAPLFVEHFAARVSAGQRVAVLSPDAGGMKRAVRFAELLAARLDAPVEFALMEKRRREGQVSGEAFGGDVADAFVIIVDDLISTGTTLARAARAAVERGAASVHAAATHAVFAPAVTDALGVPEIESIVVTDSVTPAPERVLPLVSKLTVLRSATRFAEEVRPLLRASASR